jgi:hypothetical protein
MPYPRPCSPSAGRRALPSSNVPEEINALARSGRGSRT